MGKRILVIDDDLYIRELYEEVLKNAGYDVQTAVDGLGGLEKIKESYFDLIFLDMIMPEMDGLGFLRELAKNTQEKKYGSIILLSNLGAERVIEEAKRNGVVTTLVKADLSPDQLLLYTKKYLEK